MSVNTKGMPEFISKYFEKGNKILIRCVIYTLCLAVCFIILVVMGHESPKIIGFLIFVSWLAVLFGWISYAKFGVSKKNYSWFLKYGNNEMLSGEINDSLMSKQTCMVVMGTQAVADRYNGLVLIPYSQFAWTFVQKGQVTSTIVHTKDGKMFTLIGVNMDMFKDLVQDHVIPASPDVIIGFGKEQKKKYKELL